jgi:aspartate kinase
MVIWKFGGSTLRDAASLRHVAQLVAERAAAGRTVVVCSALQGVTNRLLAAAEQFRAGLLRGAANGGERSAAAEALVCEHFAVLANLQLNGQHYAAEEELRACARDLLLRFAPPGRACDAAWLDAVVSFGERASAVLLAAALRQHGLNAQAADAREFIVTTADFGEARPLWFETRAATRSVLPGLLRGGVLPVVTGFIGAARDGRTTTLGRNSSDLSAAILAWALDAESVCLWKDVPGIFDAPATGLLRQISFADAARFAGNGARIFHPGILAPLCEKSIPVWLGSAAQPDAPGTWIGPLPPARRAGGLP